MVTSDMRLASRDAAGPLLWVLGRWQGMGSCLSVPICKMGT
jgi:hypothetical protein